MKTYLDWSAYQDAGMGDAYADIPRHGGDFAKAVAVCINSRQCEADGKQVMCPSFKISGNPNLSTGGRVRLLKTALSEDLVEQAMADPVLAEAMDLCLACKGCKRECESSVDMALIKSEYLAQRTARNGLDRRSRLFASTPRWLFKAPWLRHLVRWRNKQRWLAKIGEHWLGLSARRALPVPVAQPFGECTAVKAVRRSDLPQVALIVDTFTRYYEPSIAEAAMRVLRAAGYTVIAVTPRDDGAHAERPLCCGRTYLAQGLIDDARNEAQRLLLALKEHADAGRMLVGLEASCVLGLRDDAQALGLGNLAADVGKQVLMFEEFLAKEAMAKRLTLPLTTLPGGQTLVHGHCHQKAVGAMKSVRRVLKLIPQHDFAMIESGCCGMAGTFGLEREHADMADALAEQGLMPTLRDNPQARVVANGFSCRQQIRNHGDARPQHLAQLLDEALDPAHVV